tara:strand:- start:1111 stop:1314 length:204 start_codon:yes stop_codon:yes gene_type:complete
MGVYDYGIVPTKEIEQESTSWNPAYTLSYYMFTVAIVLTGLGAIGAYWDSIYMAGLNLWCTVYGLIM